VYAAIPEVPVSEVEYDGFNLVLLEVCEHILVVVVADVKDVKDDEDDSWLVEMRHSSPSPTVSSSLPSLLQSLP
jgi:hypothetical protein